MREKRSDQQDAARAVAHAAVMAPAARCLDDRVLAVGVAHAGRDGAILVFVGHTDDRGDRHRSGPAAKYHAEYWFAGIVPTHRST